MRNIGVVTVGRSDYGIYKPILARILADKQLDLKLFVGGMHLSPEFGLTVNTIVNDGFEIDEQIDMLLSDDTPEGIAKSTGLGVIGFAEAYSRTRPDILVVLGDRFEMHAAVQAALPFKIPVAHISGGEVTLGAFDDALRHSITKLSHLHFVATQEYGDRILQMGEESWRVTNTGSPSLDSLLSHSETCVKSIELKYGFKLEPPPLLVTFHPVTLEYERNEWYIDELLAALDSWKGSVVFTLPNSDTNGRIIIQKIKEFVDVHNLSWLVENLGTPDYFSVMSSAAAMVGNSSSGIVEAAPLGVPVVNVGTRQQGRIRTDNIIDVGYSRSEIMRGISEAVSKDFHKKSRQVVSPYGDGRASESIVQILKTVALDDKLLIKRFKDRKYGRQ